MATQAIIPNDQSFVRELHNFRNQPEQDSWFKQALLPLNLICYAGNTVFRPAFPATGFTVLTFRFQVGHGILWLHNTIQLHYDTQIHDCNDDRQTTHLRAS